MYAITAHDRALIDEAIAAGAVRHIPLGVSGINWVTKSPWPSVEEAIAAHEAETERLRAIYQSLMAKPKRIVARKCGRDTGKAPTPRDEASARHTARQQARASRDERIIALRAQGLTFDAVAQSIGMSKSSVYRICTGG